MNKFQLIQVLKILFPSALEVSGYTIAVDDGGNATIATWDAALGTEPTAETLTGTLATMQLQQAQQAQITALTTSYNQAGYAPVSYMSTSFPSDPNTLLLLSCTLAQGSTPQGLPNGFQWFDSTGTGVSMTVVDLQGLGNTIFQQVYSAYVKLQGFIKQVYAAVTIAAVQQIVWS